MEWYVYRHYWNSNKIEPYNIFNHGGFMKDVKEYLKSCSDKVDFADRLRSSLMYYYWSKCEWEVLVSPWVESKHRHGLKVDVYDQVKLNWDKFVDYVWSHKGGNFCD